MSSREQCQQLLRTIDAVLEECANDPRRRRIAKPTNRPAWPGPSWLQGQRAGDDTRSHASSSP